MNTPAGPPPAVRPYGDTTGDGMVQLSFTLPLPHGALAEGTALQLARQMGMDRPLLVHARPVGTEFTFCVVYGPVVHEVELDSVDVVEREYPLLSSQEVDEGLHENLGRDCVVVGACIGTDAHTVGIDAILNIKGFAGQKGLEYYHSMRVVNLGAQVSVPDLVHRAVRENADAVLVSQAVTQRDAHLANVRELSAELDAAYAGRPRPLLVVGGPRFDPAMTADLGVDRIFGRGTTPDDVASYLVHALTVGRSRVRELDLDLDVDLDLDESVHDGESASVGEDAEETAGTAVSADRSFL
ncbi:OAM dimerization domain-containing protein [Streptomyces sp. NBC_01428]|uniref:lysine 5,6-aminomutase subunit beta n=1 Tax=Streptomyces sp. NBC_01428 TaxID=2903861 RepID=UPI002E31CE50|nr:OAM dimerization domain-containing protein [Streptomyces sp. NBC_01428]